MTPGIYTDMPASEYRAAEGVSQSMLKILREHRPAHLQTALQNPPEQTADMRLGEAIHEAVLQPELFKQNWAHAGRCEEVKKNGEQCDNTGINRWGGHWFCGIPAHQPEGVGLPDVVKSLSPLEVVTIRGVVESIKAHPYARRLLVGETELSLWWEDEKTGLLCKGRLDKLNRERRRIVDLKTCQDASPEAYKKLNAEYGFYMQAAHYMNGAIANGIEIDDALFVLVEKKPPYGINIYEMTTQELAAGEAELQRAMRIYAECVESGEWPSYEVKVLESGLPGYAWTKINERIAMEI